MWNPGPCRTGGSSGDTLNGAERAAEYPVIALRPGLKVVLASQPVEFRKSVHTLSALVSGKREAHPT